MSGMVMNTRREVRPGRVAWMGEGYEVHADGTVYRVTLRDNLRHTVRRVKDAATVAAVQAAYREAHPA